MRMHPLLRPVIAVVALSVAATVIGNPVMSFSQDGQSITYVAKGVHSAPPVGAPGDERDRARTQTLGLLIASFVALVIAVGGVQGIRTLISVAITAAGVLWILLPALLAGYNPILSAVVVCSLVAVMALLITAGWSIKTLAAVTGTAGGVMAAGLLAIAAGEGVRLTVLDLDEMQALAQLPGAMTLDYTGILFAAMMIGALGAVMDVGMSIASAISEVGRANPRLTFSELMQSGMSVGRDIMGTMANTLILAYTAGTIPLLLMLMAHDTPLSKIASVETVTVEIIRMMAGSTGLIACIPITTLVTSLLLGLRR